MLISEYITPVMYQDPSGEFPILLIMMAIGFATGAVLGGGMSIISQAMANHGNLSSINWWLVLMDGVVGGISGAMSATSIGCIGSMILGASLGAASSIAEDLLIYNLSEINLTKLYISIGIGVVGGILSGGGANVKAISAKQKIITNQLSKNLGPRKMGMYMSKQALINGQVKTQMFRFTASIVSSEILSRYVYIKLENQ